jgi:SAM-dependent methyltransferase
VTSGDPQLSEQQRQTKDYFSRNASQWREKALSREETFNILQVRNQYVLDRIGDTKRTVLDLGCGSGELAALLANEGHDVVGIDFAPEMIRKASELARENLKFVESEALEANFPPAKFEVIIANGLIEYLSREEWKTLSLKIAGWLCPSGRLFLHSRNRLFNVFSQNEYTRTEERLETLYDLHREIRGEPSSRTEYPPFSEHPIQEIAVNWRHQYTPAEIRETLSQVGLTIVHLQPAHFHAFPPSFGKRFSQLHDVFALEMQPFLEKNLGLLPQCSSFFIEAVNDR